MKERPETEPDPRPVTGPITLDGSSANELILKGKIGKDYRDCVVARERTRHTVSILDGNTCLAGKASAVLIWQQA